MKRWIRSAGPIAVALAGLVGCSDDGSTGPSDEPDVSASLAGFPPGSPADGTYELWISFALLREPGLRHAEAASAGKFRVDDSGQPVDLEGGAMVFEIRPDDPNAQVDGDGNVIWQLAADAFVTVEADDDGEPNLPALIAGSFVGGVCELAMDQGDAIRVDLADAAGSFLLATPTTPETTDETRGVWLVEPGGTAGSLILPTLRIADLWSWAAWIEDTTGRRASLGGFLDPSGPDTDGAGPLGGEGYDSPGSDFPFNDTTDLSTATVFVTLEPAGDADGPGAFLEILRSGASGVAPGVPVEMARSLSSLPSATVEIPFSSGVR